MLIPLQRPGAQGAQGAGQPAKAAPAAKPRPKPAAKSRQERLAQELAAFERARAKLRLQDPRHALLCLPATYVDCRHPQQHLGHPDTDERKLFALRLTGSMEGFRAGEKRPFVDFGKDGWSRPDMLQCKGGGRVEVEFEDQDGHRVIWSRFDGAFGAARDFEDAVAGEMVVLSGKISRFGNKLMLDNVERVPRTAVGTVWARYLGIAGQVNGEVVERLVLGQKDNPQAYEACAQLLRQACGMDDVQALAAVAVEHDTMRFESFEQLLHMLHAPPTPQHAEQARETCQRLSALSVQVSALRRHHRSRYDGCGVPLSQEVLRQLVASQPERLSAEQVAAVGGIASDLTRDVPLMGLLTGDVGTGKTLAYALPVVAAHLAGARCAVIAPTDLLANQIARQLQTRFGPQGARVVRVPTGARKLEDPQAILVSTYGLAGTAERMGYAPHVLVCDEQQKMSVTAREALVRPWTHVVEATATPIPRSMATVLYGGMTTYGLGKPPVEKRVESALFDIANGSALGRAAALVRKTVEAGKRVAIIYPRVQSEVEDTKSVLSGAQALQEKFPGKVVVLHGSMKPEAKQEAMNRVLSGECPIVVASTVLETGIDLPDMAAMVVRDAHHFGATQLHQLRGRLARNGGYGAFMLMVPDCEALPPETLKRLQSVCKIQDGYALAELDLALRGFGDLDEDGEAQSGDTSSVFRLTRLKAEDFMGLRIEGVQLQEQVANGLGMPLPPFKHGAPAAPAPKARAKAKAKEAQGAAAAPASPAAPSVPRIPGPATAAPAQAVPGEPADAHDESPDEEPAPRVRDRGQSALF